MDIWVISTFWLLWIMLWTLMQKYVWIPDFNSVGYILRKTTGIYGNLCLTFEECQAIFYSSCAILNFHQQYMEVPVITYLCQYLLLYCIFDDNHLNGFWQFGYNVSWYGSLSVSYWYFVELIRLVDSHLSLNLGVSSHYFFW